MVYDLWVYGNDLLGNLITRKYAYTAFSLNIVRGDAEFYKRVAINVTVQV